jgi:hypothetical protein
MKRAALILILVSVTPPEGGCKTDECAAAKKHMCDNITGQMCMTSTMDNAKTKVEAACGKEEALRYYDYVETKCADKVFRSAPFDCDAISTASTTGSNLDKGVPRIDVRVCGTRTMGYSGKCTADGRSAELQLVFSATAGGVTVSGTLRAAGVCGSGIQLQRTDISFTGTLSGTWESAGATINASWKGGDYACDGKLLTGSEWPTSGSLTISIAGNQVTLQRIISKAEPYTFSTSGQVFTPSDC